MDFQSLLNISDALFNTPLSNSQLFLDQIQKVHLSELVFLPSQSSSALKGGAIYCKGCGDFEVRDSRFDSQQSLIQGGAIYLQT